MYCHLFSVTDQVHICSHHFLSFHAKRVAESLGKFMVEFLPPDCKSKGSSSLLKELCSIALSILRKKGTGSRAKFQPVTAFLAEFVSAHGESVETGTLEALKGQIVPESTKEVTVVLTDLLLAAVDEFQASSQTASMAQAKEQGQGQPPFESKSQPPKGNSFHGEEFCGMLGLFKACLEQCPSYFFQIPSAPGLEGPADLLYRKASDAAAAALNDPDVSIAQHAMEFLESLVRR